MPLACDTSHPPSRPYLLPYSMARTTTLQPDAKINDTTQVCVCVWGGGMKRWKYSKKRTKKARIAISLFR